MAERTPHRWWAAANAAGLVLTLVMNGLANGLPLNGKGTGELSDAYPNLFVPAGLTFSIWGLIYLLLLGFIGFQVVKAMKGTGDDADIDKIGPWFLVSCVANSLWIVAWHWQRVAVALVIMLAILGSLIAMYLRLGIGKQKPAWPKLVFVHLPISVYLGWITVATIANVTTLLVDFGITQLPPSAVFWTVAVMTVAVALAGVMLFVRHDRAFAGVVIWALLGIWIKRDRIGAAHDAAIEWMALGGIGLLVLLVAAQLVLQARAKEPSVALSR